MTANTSKGVEERAWGGEGGGDSLKLKPVDGGKGGGERERERESKHKANVQSTI